MTPESALAIAGGVRFHAPRREKLGQLISRQLLTAIVRGYYPSGALLPSERELTELFGASRIAIREALSDLEANGVITVAHGKGSTVTPREQWNALDPEVLMLMGGEEAFAQLDELRHILEPALAALAAERIDDAGLEALRQLADLPDDDTVEQHVERDMAFHNAIARATRNPVLMVVMSSIDPLLRESRRRAMAVPGELAKARASHHAVFAAIASRDPAAASAAMTAHMQQVAGALLKHKASAAG